jgi:large subunit ribosomal protein L16
MFLQPRKVRWRKQRRGSHKGFSYRGNKLAFGEYGIQALDRFYMTQRQIEAVRVTLVRSLKKGAKIWIRVFPDIPYTKKPNEVRMGGGKGDPEFWVARIKPGRILFEFSGVPLEVAQEAWRLADSKLPIKTRLVVSPEILEKGGKK